MDDDSRTQLKQAISTHGGPIAEAMKAVHAAVDPLGNGPATRAVAVLHARLGAALIDVNQMSGGAESFDGGPKTPPPPE